MHGSLADHLARISPFLGGYYLTLALMNSVAAFYLWHYKHRVISALVWTAIAFALVLTSGFAMSGEPPGLADWLRQDINWATGPVVYSVGTTLFLVVMFVGRRFFVQPMVAWT